MESLQDYIVKLSYKNDKEGYWIGECTVHVCVKVGKDLNSHDWVTLLTGVWGYPQRGRGSGE